MVKSSNTNIIVDKISNANWKSIERFNLCDYPIWRFNKFLSLKECKSLIDLSLLAYKKLRSNLEFNKSEFKVGEQHLLVGFRYSLSGKPSIRNFYLKGPLIEKLKERIFEVFDFPLIFIPEDIRIRVYKTTDHNFHVDNRGNSFATFLFYLNDIPPEFGGATIYRNLDDSNCDSFTVSGKIGDLIVHLNEFNGTSIENIVHKSAKVSKTKWVCTVPLRFGSPAHNFSEITLERPPIRKFGEF